MKVLQNISTHVTRVYRDQLDLLSDDQFLWQPYQLDILPGYCLQGEQVWRSRVPMVCFDRVEWHLPDRVHRQFGILQGIPQPCDTGRDLHHIDRRGSSHVIWAQEHQNFIIQWNERLMRLTAGVFGVELMTYTHPYMIWYRSITRLLIGNPTARHSLGYRGASGIVEGLVRLSISHNMFNVHIFMV